LNELQEVQREAFVFAFVYGMSHSEIATRMKTPLGTAKSWVRRGLQQLKTCLGG
jgi:RNA polymerase sigma-70 factor (ECF subfamily)